MKPAPFEYHAPESVADAVKQGVRAAVAVEWGKKPLCVVHLLTL